MFVIGEPLDESTVPSLVERVLGPLIARGVLLPEKDGEYPAGPAHEEILCAEGHHPHGWVRVARGDGALGRGVFGGGEGGAQGTRCPACALALRLDGKSSENDAWANAIDDWWKGGDGLLACQGCGAERAVHDWPADRPLAFGYLAFEFWNWASLADGFVADTRGTIGLRVVVVRGRF
jgi:hypothetical protein